ncbi:MAG: acyl-ACP desaturase [Polyangiales bacterium]|nr:acyl-ACP desaturase [Myxococcales bacterium]MCB9661258.1 acyl-ACP desaturase [Sandaracinaceae bacterium]
MASDQYHEKLYQRFRTFFDEAEQNRRWNPYRDVPWDKINPELPEHVALCAETFLGVEAYLPDYIRFGMDAVRASSVAQRWFAANWGYEELKHSMVLTEYLLRSGKRTESQMFDFQQKLMQQVWERPFESARQMTIYGVFQEMATFVIYLRHEKVAQRYDDEALATAYRLAARDEVAHARFYEDVTKVCLEEDREGTLRDINLVVKGFEMPGVGIVPDYDARIEVMREEGAVDRDLFYKKVFFPTLRRLGVDRAELGAAARREREERRSGQAAE